MMPSALVLSAGLGTRLDPITRIVAKPAVPLGDRTLIERVLLWLRGHGVDDVVLNLHHRPATITSVIGDGRHLGLTVRYSWEQPILGSAGGPRRALPLLGSDPFVIVNGDTLCDVDLKRMAVAHAASGAKVTMAVVPHPAPDRYNGFQADAQGVVTAWVPKGHTGPSWHFVGVQVAAREVFAGLTDGVPAEIVVDLYRAMIPHGAIRVFPVNAPFIDVGTPRDYVAAARTFEPGATQAGRALSIVWPSARVDPGSALDDCLVIGDVRVPAGFRAARSILAPVSVVRPDDRVAVRDGVALFDLGAG